MGEGLHRILSYQSYASGDNDRVHTLSFWDMKYREECTTSQMLETFYFCVQKVDVESIEFINFIFNPFKRLCCEKEKHFKKIMKKKFFKAALAIAAIATVGIGSYKAYDSYTAANM